MKKRKLGLTLYIDNNYEVTCRDMFWLKNFKYY